MLNAVDFDKRRQRFEELATGLRRERVAVATMGMSDAEAAGYRKQLDVVIAGLEQARAIMGLAFQVRQTKEMEKRRRQSGRPSPWSGHDGMPGPV